MGLKIWDFWKPKNGKTKLKEISVKEIFESTSAEYHLRQLSFWACVNLLANAVARCEFRTYRGNEEVFEREYYLWNIEPNGNQNSTVFLHKLVAKLCEKNEAIIISTRKRDGYETLSVADEWEISEESPTRQAEYKKVKIDDYSFEKTFRENDVLHLKLNHIDLKPVIEGIYESYDKMIDAAIAAYEKDNGERWKVHIDRMRQGDKAFEDAFNQILQTQIKPFLSSANGLLPEFDGYKFEDVGSNKGNRGNASGIQSLMDDIFNMTARAFQIPAVLINGKIEGTKDANERFLTNCVDPICDQLQEEITRKRYGYESWQSGNFIRVDSSSILHFDMMSNAGNIEKLIGSGVFTINDVLRAANQQKINENWANAHYMTLNIAGVGEQTREISASEGGE